MSASIVLLDDVLPGPRRIALGTFDGVHLGHRRVVAGADAVVTFDPHPLEAVAPHRAPLVLTSLARRAELLGGLGVRELVVVPFDDELRQCSPEAFVDRVLVGALGARHVSVGPDFRFGHRGAGDVAVLTRDRRFSAEAVPVLELGGRRVSSTRVRELLDHGAVQDAAELLGAPFTLEGVLVDTGGARAEISALELPVRRAVPAAGCYACRVAVDSGPDVATRVTIGRPRTAAGGDALVVPCRVGGAVGGRRLAAGSPMRISFLRRILAVAPVPRRDLRPVLAPRRRSRAEARSSW